MIEPMLERLSLFPWLPQCLSTPVVRLMGASCPAEIPPSVLDALHPSEREYANTLSGDPRRQWVAGRRCLGEAIGAGHSKAPLLTLASGRPASPTGFVGSISHKGAVSIAAAAQRFSGLGVDLELVDQNDVGLAPKVLGHRERHRFDRVSALLRAPYVVAHFALKEAVYKALPDAEQEVIEFHDIELGLAEQMLERQEVWQDVDVTLLSGSQCYARVFRDGRWIITIAFRL